MSQNKTVIQGLEPETQTGKAPSSASPNFYSRGGNAAPAKGTVVPGMMSGAQPVGGAQGLNPEPAASPQPKRVVQPGKPIVGFLFSISRTPMGEFWPIQMGRNTIGQAADNDIVLPEGSVSGSHAVIVTRQVKGGIIAAITDSQSTNGTMINGEVIGFSAEECHDGDIITIGNNYELVLMLVDVAKRGLSVSKDFIPVEVESADDENLDDVPPFSPGVTRPGGFDPYDGPATWGGSMGGTAGGGGFAPAGGTVGMDGSTTGGKPGGTIPL